MALAQNFVAGLSGQQRGIENAFGLTGLSARRKTLKAQAKIAEQQAVAAEKANAFIDKFLGKIMNPSDEDEQAESDAFKARFGPALQSAAPGFERNPFADDISRGFGVDEFIRTAAASGSGPVAQSAANDLAKRQAAANLMVEQGFQEPLFARNRQRDLAAEPFAGFPVLSQATQSLRDTTLSGDSLFGRLLGAPGGQDRGVGATEVPGLFSELQTAGGEEEAVMQMLGMLPDATQGIGLGETAADGDIMSLLFGLAQDRQARMDTPRASRVQGSLGMNNEEHQMVRAMLKSFLEGDI